MFYCPAVFETRAKKLMAVGLVTLESWKPQRKEVKANDKIEARLVKR